MSKVIHVFRKHPVQPQYKTHFSNLTLTYRPGRRPPQQRVRQDGHVRLVERQVQRAPAAAALDRRGQEPLRPRPHPLGLPLVHLRQVAQTARALRVPVDGLQLVQRHLQAGVVLAGRLTAA